MDPDGDVVKCRWALSDNLECGDACQGLSANSLDSVQVKFNAQKTQQLFSDVVKEYNNLRYFVSFDKRHAQ